MVNITVLGKIPSKKNSKRVFCVAGKPRVISSKAHEEWHDEAMLLLASERNKLSPADRNHLPIKKAHHVGIVMYSHDARAFDLTNKAESIMDILVDAGFLFDDDCATVGVLHLEFGGVDRKNPRAEVSITR